MIDARNITVDGILHGTDFTGGGGQVTGIIGPNGAGKSTLLTALAGVHRRARGSVTVESGTGPADITRMRDGARAKLIATVPQDTVLDFDFTARDVVGFGRQPHLGRAQKLSAGDEQVVDDAIRRVGAERFADRTVPTLSGGERQLTHIARAVAQETPVILLDEPVSALDLKHELVVLSLLRSLADRGQTVVTVLHDLTQAARFCDRLVLLSDGRVRAAGTPREVLVPDILDRTYGIRSVIRDDPDTRCPTVTALAPSPNLPGITER